MVIVSSEAEQKILETSEVLKDIILQSTSGEDAKARIKGRRDVCERVLDSVKSFHGGKLPVVKKPAPVVERIGR